jgi:hypothetical protein
MGVIVKQVLITSGDLSLAQVVAGGAPSTLHLPGVRPGRAVIDVLPIGPGTVAAPGLIITGVSWAPFSALRNMGRAFRWIRVRRAPSGPNKVLVAAQGAGSPGRVVVNIDVQVEDLSKIAFFDFTGNANPLTVNVHGFKCLRNNNGTSPLLTLPAADENTIGAEFYVQSQATAGNPGFRLEVARAADSILLQKNPGARSASGGGFNKLATTAADQFTVLACRDVNTWVAEARTDDWVGRGAN